MSRVIASSFGKIPTTSVSRLIAKEPAAGPDWVHEIKHDGFRILARRDVALVRLFTRNDTTSRHAFPRSPRRWKSYRYALVCSTARPSWSTSAASRSSTLSVIGSATMTPCYVPSICSSSTAPTCAATHLRSHER